MAQRMLVKACDLVIISDFDGTIAECDTTDLLLSRFASPSWHEIEHRWEVGEIGSAECMRQQIALIMATEDDLKKTLDTVRLDAGFADFAEICRQSDIPLMIVSDGLDASIKYLLEKNHLSNLPITANRLICNENSSFRLETPHEIKNCRVLAGVCKCNVIRNFIKTHDRTRVIFIGDGRSDFCAAGIADMVLAKASLLEYCRKNSIPHLPINDFVDAKRELMDILKF
ncbi:MAG: MtnX-like HAD-IB family phosphatase [Candidatus Riflebacteria bacterium]|nr:MtnX-like HAD-IB family phosphatase [Candidatus Riflebacteria bacterium]